MPESFVFYESYLRGIELQDEQVQSKLFLALCRYALRGEEPSGLTGSELGIFELMRPTIDANTQRRENGSKGGEKKGNTNAAKKTKRPMVESTEETKRPMVESTEETKRPMVVFSDQQKRPNENENETENGNENETETKNENGNGKTTEKTTADYSVVELTDEELSELEKLSDSLSVKTYIKKLSDWQQENNKRSHKPFAVIKKWILQDGEYPTKRNYIPPASEKEQSYNIDSVIERASNYLSNKTGQLDK